MRLNVFRVVVVAALAAASSALPAVESLAATAAPSVSMTTPDLAVTTTTGQHLNLILAGDGHGSSLTAKVVVHHGPLGAASEEHMWTAPVSRSSLAFNGTSGHFAVGSQLAPYGTFSLSFSKVSATTTQCVNDSNQPTRVTRVNVRVRAVVNIALRNPSAASRWGSVRLGAASSPYSFAHYGHYVTRTNGWCRGSSAPPPPATCYSGWGWSPVSVPGVSGYSVSDGTSTQSLIHLARIVTLSRPAHASRYDFLAIQVPPLVVTSSDPDTTITVRTARTASGSATLHVSGAPSGNAPAMSCRVAGSTTAHQQAIHYWTVSWQNGATPFAVTPAIGIAVKVPDGTQTLVDQETYS
jgi:hypothetical protein